VYITGIDVFANHLVRDGARRRIDAARDRRSSRWQIASHYVSGAGLLHRAESEPHFDTNVFRYTYTSLSRLTARTDYDMDSRQQTLLKRVEVRITIRRNTPRSEFSRPPGMA